MRRDIFINGAAPLLAISGRDLGGHDRSRLVSDPGAAARAGLVLPVELLHPEPFVIRVVEGELDGKETSEWVGHVASRLVCPEGVLHLEAGFGPLPDLASLRELRVASGVLRIDLYTYLGGTLNGDACYGQVSGSVPLGRWFRASRPGEEFPDWLALRCLEDPEVDPGFEADWQELAGTRSLARTRSRLQARPALAFVLQVRPQGEGVGVTELGARGWVPATAGARLPDFCPRGIDATVALEEESEDTDLPMSTELPDGVQTPAGDRERGFWARVSRWVGRGD